MTQTWKLFSMPNLLHVNLIHIFLLPTLILIAIPLLGIALVTASLSISFLAFRVVLVYLELGLALIRVHFFPTAASPFYSGPRPSSRTPSTNPSTPRRRKSGGRLEGFTPSVEAVNPLEGSQNPIKDFETVGGWREIVQDGDRAEDWERMNSRLELPSLAMAGRARNHRRALSSHGLTLTIPPDMKVTSPDSTPMQLGGSATEIATAPAFSAASPEDYFLPGAAQRPQGGSGEANIKRQRKSSSESPPSPVELRMTRNSFK